ncbi:sensor domain-containing diguanylate cyclase [Telmatospirillum sp.]|uniref:sensor domain-containing diguanylate cyclase n=1 Tax=Telmatospirillum sp. TaxID=2079197 RepID=UPI0028471FDF|nr:sensor domain-containing diguanylate cyclase [Telmatospirillum sp.]MDR3440582.1 sensor domain-containing diguanylate cyclase [Telmatospirillum sp.]
MSGDKLAHPGGWATHPDNPAWYRRLLAAASEVAIIATDTQGVITVFNRGAEKMLGYPAAELVGRQTPAAFHLAEEVAARAKEMSVALGRPVTGFRTFTTRPDLAGSEKREWTFVRKDGRRVTVSLVVTPVCDDDGATCGYLGMAVDVTDRVRATRELKTLARTDPLTGLANRRVFAEAAEAEFERCKRFDTTAALLMIDIDHFKAVNDARGHEAGDKALVALANLLTATVRTTDVPARYGGEEFVVLLTGTTLAGAADLAERIRERTARITAPSPSGAFGLTISIGATVFTPGDKDWTEALRRADQALYQAKSTGRNKVTAAA